MITLTSYQAVINAGIGASKRFPDLRRRAAERRDLFHNGLISHLPESFSPGFQDGDGDCMMT